MSGSQNLVYNSVSHFRIVFERPYIKRAISTKKKLTKMFQIINLLFLRKMIIDKVGPLMRE